MNNDHFLMHAVITVLLGIFTLTLVALAVVGTEQRGRHCQTIGVDC